MMRFVSFWELDAIRNKEETRPPMTAEKKAAVKKVSETLKFLNGHYEIEIPWKNEEPKLVNNYEAAFARLQRQEKSLRKKGPEVIQVYNHIFEEYERKGYIQEVRKSDVKEQWFAGSNGLKEQWSRCLGTLKNKFKFTEKIVFL